jgi:ribosome biogenesis GTPase A
MIPTSNLIRLRPPPSRLLLNNASVRSFCGAKRPGEEQQIAKTILYLKDSKPEIMVQVERVQLVGCNFLPSAVEQVMASSSVRIKCLTHADTISDAALRHQIAFVEEQERRKQHEFPTAIFALNLQEGTKAKQLHLLRDAIFGASKLAMHNQIIVCGSPNAGKSSLILPLTKARTMEVKNKKSFHLPKVSQRAGHTLAIKRHVLEAPNQRDVTLHDTPGLRPRIDEGTDRRFLALMLAARVTEPSKGFKSNALNDTILQLLLQAANRHATLSSEQPTYMELLELDSPTEDPALFLEAFCRIHTGQPTVTDAIRKLQSGELGGLIFTHYRELAPDPKSMRFNRKSAIVYMNKTATELVNSSNGF